MRYWSTLPHRTVAETEIWVAETLANVASGETDDFVITLNGQLIGKAGLWYKNELGILLARAQWRQGYAREASAQSSSAHLSGEFLRLPRMSIPGTKPACNS